MCKRNINKTMWWPTVVVFCCLASTAFAAPKKCVPKKDCVQVPEGGSAVVYIVGASLACFGAMVLKSRMSKADTAAPHS
jgi:hypothetical protein